MRLQLPARSSAQDPVLPDGLYKELSYNVVSGLLEAVEYYRDSSKTVHLYSKQFSYDVDELLTEIETTRISDGAVFVKTLTYNAEDQLATIDS